MYIYHATMYVVPHCPNFLRTKVHSEILMGHPDCGSHLCYTVLRLSSSVCMYYGQ